MKLPDPKRHYDKSYAALLSFTVILQRHLCNKKSPFFIKIKWRVPLDSAQTTLQYWTLPTWIYFGRL